MSRFLPAIIYLIANLTPNSASLAWVTPKLTRPCLVLTSQKNPLLQSLILNASRLLPLANKTCQAHPSQTHLISVTGLKPQTTYYLYPLNHFFSPVLKPITFTTPSLSDQPPSLPQPAYGTILNNQAQPIVNALTLIRSQNQLLAALTNHQGNWLVDLSYLHSPDQLQLQVLTASQSSNPIPIDPAQTQPVSTLIIP